MSFVEKHADAFASEMLSLLKRADGETVDSTVTTTTTTAPITKHADHGTAAVATTAVTEITTAVTVVAEAAVHDGDAVPTQQKPPKSAPAPRSGAAAVADTVAHTDATAAKAEAKQPHPLNHYRLQQSATLPPSLQRSRTAPVVPAATVDAEGRTAFPSAAAEMLSAELPESMLKGTRMLLFKPSKEDLSERMFRVDVNQLRVIWQTRSGSKEKHINVESITEYRVGEYLPAEVLKHPKLDEVAKLRAFSIVYMEHSRCESLYLVPLDTEDQVDWLTGLRVLVMRYCHQDKENETTVREREHVWLRRQWTLGDRDQDGLMSLDEFVQICQRMNVSLSRKELKQHFKAAAGSKEAQIGFDKFIHLVESLNVREEVLDIFCAYSGARQQTVGGDQSALVSMPAASFTNFLTKVQKMTLPKEEMEALVTKYADQDNGAAVSFQSFLQFLNGDDNSVMLPVNRSVWQDMRQPLSHYFINSSHNTYLIGNQLTGKSSVDAYTYALDQGFRCLELDCWDGPDGEPVIYHGYTLTSKILFSDSIASIKKRAFERSPYPVILSLEVHCGLRQQERMAAILREELGDMLVSEFLDSSEMRLPSPHDMMYRFLVKTKGLGRGGDMVPALQRSSTIAVAGSDVAADTDSDGEESQGKEKKVQKFCKALASLAVYCQTKHFVDYEHSEANDAYYEMSSFSEASGAALAKKVPAAAVRHNSKRLSRIYPAGKRVTSTNYNPTVHWGVGAQLVALNAQTYDRYVQLNRAMFQQNGGCGYVLKPRHLRIPGHLLGSVPRHSGALRIKIISGQHLPRSNNNERGDVIDPYCVVKLVTPAGSQKKLTKHVTDNGFNPVWNAEFSFDVSDADLTFLRIAVKDKNKATKDVFIASFCAILSNLESGYRHLPLRDRKGNPLLRSTLFVHISLSGTYAHGAR
ncbi:PLC-like phosphodiesterase [Thamnocephalis sphaerospora]|uniref:Phosphoinositide phospholipase C n=1 Tax=Thamnocephalis sphaerospora TaxID=78915 RepID=A0A4P9XVH2_9FUNG|nr:PLC-like phosphodiesterase [Thamnocephalis sphaerospora]|eukprot:RKP10273.1 PLC-like phosphodiesterase [Thamnocephalis sphaerospora]